LVKIDFHFLCLKDFEGTCKLRSNLHNSIKIVMDPSALSPTNEIKDIKSKKQQASATDEFVLEDLYGTADFDFNLTDYHSDATNTLQKFVRKEVIKATLKKQYQNASKIREAAKDVKQSLIIRKNSIVQQNDKLKQAIKTKKMKLEAKLQTPPFVRTSDKFAFTVGIILLCLTEYFILKKPEAMGLFYTLLIFPLLITRYFSYHKVKYHYFMLDFCYYVQVLLLCSIYVVPSPEFFQIVFALSNGPLCVAIVMWRNSLVFHDLDKLTSVFIHIFPPLVTFCMRWFPPGGDYSLVCVEPDCSMGVYYAISVAMVYYCIWQALYLIKTELFDKEKLARDKDIMTSVKWMTQVKPHPIYLMMLKCGLRPNPVVALTAVQGVYTLFTLLPNFVIFQYFELHCIYLSIIFIVCIWNGANFYFEIFSETYSARLKGYLKEMEVEKAAKKEGKSPQVERKQNEASKMDSGSSPAQTSTQTING